MGIQKQNLRRWRIRELALAGFVLGGCMFSTPAMAQTVNYAGEMNVPWGHSYRDENAPYQAKTRDSNGNRIIINGRIIDNYGSTLPGTLSGDYFSSQSDYGLGNVGAIGNQLNVVTQGNWNTVIVDSTQINNGNQTVNANNSTGSNDSGACCTPPIEEDGSNSEELNGEINLND